MRESRGRRHPLRPQGVASESDVRQRGDVGWGEAPLCTLLDTGHPERPRRGSLVPGPVAVAALLRGASRVVLGLLAEAEQGESRVEMLRGCRWIGLGWAGLPARVVGCAAWSGGARGLEQRGVGMRWEGGREAGEGLRLEG